MGSEGISLEELAASEDWRPHYLGSVVVWGEAHDEGEGHGFDLLDRSAMVREYRRVSRDPEEILDWYEDQLNRRGWARTGDFGDRGLGAWYQRETSKRSEHYVIVIRSQEPLSMPPGAQARPGTTMFDVMLKASSRGDPRAGDRPIQA